MHHHIKIRWIKLSLIFVLRRFVDPERFGLFIKLSRVYSTQGSFDFLVIEVIQIHH